MPIEDVEEIRHEFEIGRLREVDGFDDPEVFEEPGRPPKVAKDPRRVAGV